MPSNGPDPGGPKPPASPAGPPASDPAPEPAAAKPLPWPWTEETAEHVLAISLERLEEIKRLRAEIERLKRAAPGPATEEMKAAYGAGYRRGFAAGQQSHQTSLPSEWVDAGWNVWCIARDRGREHGRPVPDADPLASMRADLKVKKTPDVDE